MDVELGESSHGYDVSGNLTQVAYSNSMTTVYTYNSVNALTGEADIAEFTHELRISGIRK